MVRKVFIDAVAWIALFNRDDDLHRQAVEVRLRLRKEKYRFVTTDFVFLEVADAFSNSEFKRSITAYLNQLRQWNGLKVLPVDENLFTQGWQLYGKRLDQDWGLTDCISFVVMDREKIMIAFTSDRHFEQAGFRRLLRP